MNKGFTLVELIVVIGLLALVAILVMTNMVGLQGKQTDKQYNDYISKLETAACTYVELSDISVNKSSCMSSGCFVTAKMLIERGLIDEDLYNPSVGKKINELEINNIKVKVYKNSENAKRCEYQEG